MVNLIKFHKCEERAFIISIAEDSLKVIIEPNRYIMSLIIFLCSYLNNFV